MRYLIPQRNRSPAGLELRSQGLGSRWSPGEAALEAPFTEKASKAKEF